MANAANGTNITMGLDNTGLVPSTAVSATELDHRLPRGGCGRSRRQQRGRGGWSAVRQGWDGLRFRLSHVAPALATDGKNKTFFRVVPDDDVQGPRDANYIINHKLAGAKGSTILIRR